MDQVLVFERAISEMTPAAPAMARLMSERAESQTFDSSKKKAPHISFKAHDANQDMMA
jgi:hypothetical protein